MGMRLAPFGQEIAQSRIYRRRRDAPEFDKLIPGELSSRPSYAAATQAQHPTGTCARWDCQLDWPRDGRCGNLCTEDRLINSDRQDDENILALTTENRMRSERQVDQRIAWCASSRARSTFSAQAQGLAILRTGRDCHGKALARRQSDVNPDGLSAPACDTPS